MMTEGLLTLAITSLLILTSFAPMGWASPLKLEISAGFHGYYRVGNWLPVIVSVENHDADLDGDLIIRLGTWRFVQSVSLFSPSRKRFAFCVFPAAGQNALSLSLSVSGQTVATAHTRLNRLSENASLIVVVSPHPSGYGFLQQPPGSRVERRVIYLPPAGLPESWKGYDAIDAVILETPEIGTLHPQQHQALIRWLLLGGKILLVDRWPHGRSSALYQDLLSQRAAAPPGQTAARLEVGNLLVTATTPDNRGILTPSGRRIGWHTWLPERPRWPAIPPAVMSRHILRRFHATPNRQAPRILYLGGFLCVYVMVVAGFFGRVSPRLATPWQRYAGGGCVVLAFALLSFCMGLVMHRGAIVVQASTLIHLFPQHPDLYVTTSAVLLTPRKQRYHVQTASVGYIRTEDTMPLTYEFTGQQTPAQLHFSAPMWANRRFWLERFTKNSWFFTTSDAPSASLVNRSPFELLYCHLIAPQGIFRLPDVRPEQSLAMTLPTTVAIEPFELGKPPALLVRSLLAYRRAVSFAASPARIVCTVNGIVPSLISPVHRVHHQGTTVLIIHLKRLRRSQPE